MRAHQSDADIAVEEVYRSDWGRIVATLIRQVGDFDLAEDAAQEAFALAIRQWRVDGVPNSPRSWIIGTAKHKAIDVIRRQSKLREILPNTIEETVVVDSDIEDERLRLICTCCHPALGMDAQVALTLRTLGGLTTEEIARAFLVTDTTMAQRLVRAKQKIRTAKIPYVVPDKADMPERLEAILATIYLIFNAGYSSGDDRAKSDLCEEAIRLGRLIKELMEPQAPSEAIGLLALMLLHEARRVSRFDANGDVILLQDQDRKKWNREQIQEALPLVEAALSAGTTPFALQAAITALHCQAQNADSTDWPQILALYNILENIHPSPVVTLNRAVAVGMVDGSQAALDLIEGLVRDGELENYYLLFATRADFYRRLGDFERASCDYAKALSLTENPSERRFLQKRLTETKS